MWDLMVEGLLRLTEKTFRDNKTMDGVAIHDEIKLKITGK
jgi:hypothetical protein